MCIRDRYKANLFLFDMEKNRVSDQLTFENKVGLHQWLDDEHLMITALREQADKDLSEKGIPLTVFYRFHIHTKQYEELFRVHKNVCQFARIDDNKYPVSYTHLYPHLYIKRIVPVTWNGVDQDMMVYVLKEPYNQVIAKPSEDYFNCIKDGYLSHGLDLDKLNDA